MIIETKMCGYVQQVFMLKLNRNLYSKSLFMLMTGYSIQVIKTSVVLLRSSNVDVVNPDGGINSPWPNFQTRYGYSR